MTFDLLTIFPNIFNSYLSESILGRARKQGLIKINIHNLRDYTLDKHKTTDDLPYGGGPGMVMKVEPIYRALKDIVPERILKEGLKKEKGKNPRIILFSTQGDIFNQKKVQELSGYQKLILICGRYEGVDQRVARYLVDEEISMGDFVLTGGELPAMIIVDAVSRLLPGVLGNKESLEEESFRKGAEREYPQYTRPAQFLNWKVPKVLLSGDHREIKEWRERNKK